MTLSVLRNASLACLVAIGFALGTPQKAQAIYCSNCGTEWTQLANNLQLVKQLEQQVLQVQNTIKQYENMLLNSLPLKKQVWSKAISEIKRLNALFKRAKSLSYASQNLDALFAKKYADYKSYLKHALGDAELSAKYQQWSEDTNDSVLSTLKAAKLQADQMEGEEDAYLRQLEEKATNAEGRMQALQVGNQAALTLARQIQKLRQLILLQLQLQAKYIQMRMDREVAQQAAWKKFTKKPAVSINNGKRY
jgi:P-type conjugative transfer protein TrbJ